jgi:hypothetical protein
MGVTLMAANYSLVEMADLTVAPASTATSPSCEPPFQPRPSAFLRDARSALRSFPSFS